MGACAYAHTHQCLRCFHAQSMGVDDDSGTNERLSLLDTPTWAFIGGYAHMQ